MQFLYESLLKKDVVTFKKEGLIHENVDFKTQGKCETEGIID